MNELTFVSHLCNLTFSRAQRLTRAGTPPLIAHGALEEQQVDMQGRVRRCDIRLNTPSGRKLVSGEVKRPETAEGRDPCHPALVEESRRKTVARGLPFYFTCNMAQVVLFAVASRAGLPDQKVATYDLAPISHSRQVAAYLPTIRASWETFLDELEKRYSPLTSGVWPGTTRTEILALRDAISAVAGEALGRVEARLRADEPFLNWTRETARSHFGFEPALQPGLLGAFRQEVNHLLRLSAFVVVQRLILSRELVEAGSQRVVPSPIVIPETSTDPQAIRTLLERANASQLQPLQDVLFLNPGNAAERQECRVGEVWSRLQKTVEAVSWADVSRNLVGFLYEVLVDQVFRHQLGQYYTRDEVVDLLTAFAVRSPGDLAMDPAAGGGSFLRSAYERKRALGADHESCLATLWGFEITAFAAELSTLSLASADTAAAAAYPRVVLEDFFAVRPGQRVPKLPGALKLPTEFDAIIGNPPYISYRRQTNQPKIVEALRDLSRPQGKRARPPITLPKFSGKSDAYVWFIVHATRFLKQGGRLAFVVSAAVLFSDYGIPLIRFLGRHYRIRAVIDSMVERWFPDADTNTVLLLLEREEEQQAREANFIRFIRLRRPLAQVLAAERPHQRRELLEELTEQLLTAPAGGEDPRVLVNLVPQGAEGGLALLDDSKSDQEHLGIEEEGE